MWIKIGQLLSLRTDVFSEAVCRELSRLQYQVIGFPLSEVEEALATEYGADVDDIFQYFSAEPIAAASISQVPLALLREPNVLVPVKVRRPRAAIACIRALRHIKWILRIHDSLGHGQSQTMHH